MDQAALDDDYIVVHRQRFSFHLLDEHLALLPSRCTVAAVRAKKDAKACECPRERTARERGGSERGTVELSPLSTVEDPSATLPAHGSARWSQAHRGRELCELRPWPRTVVRQRCPLSPCVTVSLSL
ncbi:unnamed protein product [Lampetra planeri]